MSLLSRVAERIYWTARYLERAETTSRLARVYGNLLLDLPQEAGLSWDVLVQITGGEDRYRELHPSPGVDTAERFFVADRENPSSVRSSLQLARESVRTTRDIVPSEVWRSINELTLWVTQELDAETSHRRRYGIHSRVVERCQQITSLLADTMSHDAAYQFFRLGRGIERADMTTRIIDVAATMLLGREGLARFDNSLWMAVLQSLSAYQMYRQKVRRRIYGPDVIAYLLKDPQFPRAVAFSLRETGAALGMLPRSGEPIKKLGDLRRMLALRNLSELSIAELHQWMDDAQLRLNELHERVAATWFRPSAPSQEPASRVYDIRHKTTFSYQHVVSSSRHVLHLLPRRHPSQTCLLAETIVDPRPAAESVGEDDFGNPVQRLAVEQPHKVLVVDAHARIEVRGAAAPALEQSPPWESIRDRLTGDPSLAERDYLAASPHVAANDDVRAYALPSFPPGRPILAAVMDLTQRIYRDFEYRGGVSDVWTPVSDVMAMRAGVCQDFAHLEIACLRSVGLAARYVSGYLLTRPLRGEAKLVGADASHAWVSVFAGDAGWVDFDPTNNVIPKIEHITFAWGRDYGDVSPISGTIVGGGAHQVSVAVDVNPTPAGLA
ncbi:MAG TPA: alpha-E domain-containing protein [Gammaproteobacteria bacterium]|nr:alpha-E domain-containing protein [Gammaproteobacteria bacterium]